MPTSHTERACGANWKSGRKDKGGKQNDWKQPKRKADGGYGEEKGAEVSRRGGEGTHGNVELSPFFAF